MRNRFLALFFPLVLAFPSQAGPSNPCLVISLVGVGVSIVGIGISAGFLGHYRESQFILGPECDDKSVAYCCQTSENTVIANTCAVANVTKPIVCGNNTQTPLCLALGKYYGPYMAYTDEASNAQVASGISLGISCALLIASGFLVVFAKTQCSG